MKGTRPLTTDEILEVPKHFGGTYAIRNRSLFLLGVNLGGRISEMLALRIGDVWQNDKPVADVLFSKHIVKGGEVSRVVPLNDTGERAVYDLMAWHQEQFGSILDPDAPLFPSRNGGGIGKRAAEDVLKDAFHAAGLNGKLGTHCMRKSFAQHLYDLSSDILLVKEMLGHKHINTTQKYLGVNYSVAREMIQALYNDHNTTPIYKAKDVELINELIMRGYGVHHLPNKEDKSQ